MADSVDVWRLLRRDHDDIDAGLAAMIHADTPFDELLRLADVVRLALAVHAAAEARIANALLSAPASPRSAEAIVNAARKAHRHQRKACDALLSLEVATSRWFEAVLDLRDDISFHAERSEHQLRELCDELPRDVRRSLASVYATERLRVFASTSPTLVADRLDAQAAAT